MKKSFKLQNLECANCAAKMEEGISRIAGVEKARISFMTSKLSVEMAPEVTKNDLARVLDEAQRIVTSFEEDCVILGR